MDNSLVPQSKPNHQRNPHFVDADLPKTNQRTYPAILHFSVVAGVLLPLFFLPYALTRRRLSLAERGVKDLRKSVEVLHQNWSSDSAVRLREHAHYRRTLEDGTRQVHELAHRLAGLENALRDLTKKVEHNESERVKSEADLRRETKELWENGG